jgi:sugar/nucleoside kinase (ribokinase family)
MAEKLDVYLYGMTVLSTIHRLKAAYPEADSYQEINRSYVVPGGETGNAAILLARLGLRVRPEGSWMGRQTKKTLLSFNRKWGVDISGMKYDPSFEGWRDVVLVDDRHRTVFGWFGGLFSKKGGRRWSKPSAAALRKAKVVSIDPFFGVDSQKAARLCRANRKPFVTMDCPPESQCHHYCAVNILSQSYLRSMAPKVSFKNLMERYRTKTQGLTVFTFGNKSIWYARPQGKIRTFTPYRVKISGTLGAGDSFRAGMVFGLWRGWRDEQSIRFAAGLAACVCRKFPVSLHPPTLQEVFRLTGKPK